MREKPTWYSAEGSATMKCEVESSSKRDEDGHGQFLKDFMGWAWWYMPIISATQEEEIEKIVLGGQP
jgi:hypothetical protein